MMLRTVECGACKRQYTEQSQNLGFPNWGQLSGIVLNGDENPYLCDTCLPKVADFIDKLGDKS